MVLLYGGRWGVGWGGVGGGGGVDENKSWNVILPVFDVCYKRHKSSILHEHVSECTISQRLASEHDWSQESKHLCVYTAGSVSEEIASVCVERLNQV